MRALQRMILVMTLFATFALLACQVDERTNSTPTPAAQENELSDCESRRWTGPRITTVDDCEKGEQ